MIPDISYLLFNHISKIYFVQMSIYQESKAIIDCDVQSLPPQFNCRSRNWDQRLVLSNPFHHSSTAKAGTGITGIKDDTTQNITGYLLFKHIFLFIKFYFTHLNSFSHAPQLKLEQPIITTSVMHSM